MRQHTSSYVYNKLQHPNRVHVRLTSPCAKAGSLDSSGSNLEPSNFQIAYPPEHLQIAFHPKGPYEKHIAPIHADEHRLLTYHSNRNAHTMILLHKIDRHVCSNIESVWIVLITYKVEGVCTHNIQFVVLSDCSWIKRWLHRPIVTIRRIVLCLDRVSYQASKWKYEY